MCYPWGDSPSFTNYPFVLPKQCNSFVVSASKTFFPGKFTVQYDAQVFHLVSSDQLLAKEFDKELVRTMCNHKNIYT